MFLVSILFVASEGVGGASTAASVDYLCPSKEGQQCDCPDSNNVCISVIPTGLFDVFTAKFAKFDASKVCSMGTDKKVYFPGEVITEKSADTYCAKITRKSFNELDALSTTAELLITSGTKYTLTATADSYCSIKSDDSILEVAPTEVAAHGDNGDATKKICISLTY